METLKVCLVAADFPPFVQGGLARYSSKLFKALQEFGLDVSLITSTPLRDFDYKDDKINSFYLPFFYNRVLKYPLFNILSLKKKTWSKFNIIHSLSTQYELGLSRIITDNLVLTVHNTFAQQLEMFYYNSRLDKILRKSFYYYMYLWEKIACKSAKKIITVSNGTAVSLMNSHGLPSNKIKVIYSGVDLEKFKDKREIPKKHKIDKGYLLFVGRIVPRKGIEYLLHAFKLIRKQKEKVKLLIIGQGEKAYQELLIKLTKQLKIENDVYFLKNVTDEDLPAFYHNASLFVFPSLVEGFGLVCLEAMACGKPVVASNIPGVREVVIHGKTGILVPPRNPAKLAEAILGLLNDESIKNKLGKNALSRSKQFSWEKTAKEVYRCYREMLSQH